MQNLGKYHPLITTKFPCDGKSCKHYCLNDNKQPCCDYFYSIYGKVFETAKISCPIKMA